MNLQFAFLLPSIFGTLAFPWFLRSLGVLDPV